MSYYSRVYRHRNAHTQDEMQQQQPFFTKKHDTAKSSGENAFFQPRFAGGGRLLPEDTLQQMNGSFRTDFSHVRIHDDSEAIEMNNELQAKAFTHGNDIYFNKGKFDAGSSEGKFLLAHELTHVVQQGGSTSQVQRAPDDKHDLTSTQLAGDPKLEACFDNEAVIAEPAKGDHVTKIQEALMQLGIDLPQFGADSKYGNETRNGVIEFQKKAGMAAPEWDGIVGRKTIGLLDLSLRNNTISMDTDKREKDFVLNDPKQEEKDEACKNKPKDQKCPDPNTTVNDAADEAIKLIDKVITEQLPPVKTKTDYPAIFAMLFRNNDNRKIDDTVDEVKTNYEKIKDFLKLIKTDPAHVRCATDCDGGCRSGSPAYHSNAGGFHIITFCPDFNKHPEKILIVLHECHHAAIQGSRDLAYADTRLVDKLDHAKALLNAASFHLYAALVNDPKSATIGPKIKDTNTIGDPAQKKNVDQALAFMEQWFRLVTFDMSTVSENMDTAKTTGRYAPKSRVDIINDIYAKWFRVTPAPSRPTETDVAKAKAIEERSGVMEKAFSNVFNIHESKGGSAWERGPGKDIQLNQQLLTLDMNHLVIALLQELVHATPDISAEREPLYVGTINDLRNDRSLDP